MRSPQKTDSKYVEPCHRNLGLNLPVPIFVPMRRSGHRRVGAFDSAWLNWQRNLNYSTNSFLPVAPAERTPIRLGLLEPVRSILVQWRGPT